MFEIRRPTCGVPVRRAFFEVPPTPPEPPTLLVFGGSQGAHALNQAMMDSIAALRRRAPRLHVIHQTGERDYNAARAAYLRAEASAEVSAGDRHRVDDLGAQLVGELAQLVARQLLERLGSVDGIQ